MRRNSNIHDVPYYSALVDYLYRAYLALLGNTEPEPVTQELEEIFKQYWPEYLLEVEIV